MSTGLVYDDRFLLHRAPYEHPENPGRLEAIRSHLVAEGLFDRCEHFPAREATAAELRAVHTQGLIDAVRATAGRDFSQLDPDTYACRDSAEAAWLAGGGPGQVAAPAVFGASRERLCPAPPPRAPRRKGSRDGVLSLQQCGDRGASSPGRRRQPHPDRGLGCAPRKRHAALLLGRSVRPLLLDAPVPLLSGNRRGR